MPSVAQIYCLDINKIQSQIVLYSVFIAFSDNHASFLILYQKLTSNYFIKTWWWWSHSVVSLCDPMDCNLLSFSVHGILQARILEWIAISFSRGSSRPRDRTRVSRIAGRRFNLWASREALSGNEFSFTSQLVRSWYHKFSYYFIKIHWSTWHFEWISFSLHWSSEILVQ